MSDDTDLDELLIDVASSIERASVDLQSGDVTAAGYELEKAARRIQRSVDMENDQ